MADVLDHHLAATKEGNGGEEPGRGRDLRELQHVLNWEKPGGHFTSLYLTLHARQYTTRLSLEDADKVCVLKMGLLLPLETCCHMMGE